MPRVEDYKELYTCFNDWKAKVAGGGGEIGPLLSPRRMSCGEKLDPEALLCRTRKKAQRRTQSALLDDQDLLSSIWIRDKDD